MVFHLLIFLYSVASLNVTLDGPSKLELKKEDLKDGAVKYKFMPMNPGAYEISIKVKDKHIKGSPFTSKISGKSINKTFLRFFRKKIRWSIIELYILLGTNLRKCNRKIPVISIVRTTHIPTSHSHCFDSTLHLCRSGQQSTVLKPFLSDSIPEINVMIVIQIHILGGGQTENFSSPYAYMAWRLRLPPNRPSSSGVDFNARFHICIKGK